MTNSKENIEPSLQELSNSKSGEIEIDLLELARKLWECRRFIVKITAFFAVFGLFVAIFSPKEYTSSVTMVPQIGDGKSKTGGLAGLAAMAGVNLGDMGGGDVLSPTIYPKIMQSIPFKRDLMYTKIKFQNISKPITLYEYYTNPANQPFNLLSTVKKYTLGLPGVILKTIKGDDHSTLLKHQNSPYLQLTIKEESIARRLSRQVSLKIDEKEGTLILSANMPEALASTEVVEATRLLLQKYITEFKVDKVKQNLQFVQQRYFEAKTNFEQKQMQLAAFKDGNRNVILASTQSTGDRLNSEFNLYFSIYSELAKQLEQAKIKVKDATPVLTVVEPAFIPNEKTKPNRFFILIGYIFLGVILSVGIVFFKEIKNKIKFKSEQK